MWVQIAISHVSQTLWEHKRCWHFQLTANSCFWVMSTMEAKDTGCSHVFFGERGGGVGRCSLRRGTLQKITVCYPTPGPAVEHSLVSCSKTWRVTPGIQLQRKRPSSHFALWASELQSQRSAQFNWSAHYFQLWKKKRKHRPTSTWECVYCLLYIIFSVFKTTNINKCAITEPTLLRLFN